MQRLKGTVSGEWKVKKINDVQRQLKQFKNKG